MPIKEYSVPKIVR